MKNLKIAIPYGITGIGLVYFFEFYGKGIVGPAFALLIISIIGSILGNHILEETRTDEFVKGLEAGAKFQGSIDKAFEEIEEAKKEVEKEFKGIGLWGDNKYEL